MIYKKYNSLMFNFQNRLHYHYKDFNKINMLCPGPIQGSLLWKTLPNISYHSHNI